MQRRSSLALLGALAFASPAAAGPTPEQALQVVNAWRASAGVPPIARFDPAFNEGCRLHDAYMGRNHYIGHTEDPAKPGYTEAGRDAAGSSVLAGGESDPKGAWEDAVFHRTGVLNPRLLVSGFDASSGYSCMKIFGAGETRAEHPDRVTLYPWPHDGQTEVPVDGIGAGYESPDPYDVVPGASQMGFLISANVDGPWPASVTTYLTDGSLVDQDGTRVPASYVATNTHDLASYLDDGFGVFPHASLRPGTRYTVRLTGSATWFEDVVLPRTNRMARGLRDEPFDRTWSFTTAGVRPTGGADGGGGPVGSAARRLALAVGGGRLRVLSSKARVAVRISDARGRVRWSRVVRSGAWVRPRLPRGTYRACALLAPTATQPTLRSCRVLRIGRTRSRAAAALLELRPPLPTVAPSIAGTPVAGASVSCSPGTWDPPAQDAVADWYVDGVPVASERVSYLVNARDVGGALRCLVRAYPGQSDSLYGRAWSPAVTVLGTGKTPPPS